MPEQRKYLRRLKIGLAGLGILFVLTGLLAEALGLDHSPGFSAGEIICLGSGVLLLLIAGLGRRFIAVYRSAAVIFLNTLLLLAATELFAAAALTVLNSRLLNSNLPAARELTDYNRSLSYYAQQPWSEQYWREIKATLKKQYQPYLVWRSFPFAGETIVIDAKGRRHTPGADSTAAAMRVFVFGGSTMWGTGAPDWGTIPAYLQQGLSKQYGVPLRVENYAESAYVSTQGLIQLLLLLEAGQVPDMVIFYDGVNDIFAARQNGHPADHQNLSQISARFRDAEPPLSKWLRNTNTLRLLQRLAAAKPPVDKGAFPGEKPLDPERLAGELAETYLNIYRIVGILAQAYHFKYYFFWQPYILEGNKILTAEEKRLLSELDWELKMDETLIRLSRETYTRVAELAPAYDRLYYLGDVFDRETGSIWIDTWGHVIPEGNLLIAREMCKLIRP